ncbi:MAG: hypothetical protein ACKO66_04580, partial [Flavobacteriales bacterium]
MSVYAGKRVGGAPSGSQPKPLSTPHPQPLYRGEGSDAQRNSIRHSPFAIRLSPFAIRHSPLATRRSPFATRHSPFPIPHSLFLIPHSPFLINSGTSSRTPR